MSDPRRDADEPHWPLDASSAEPAAPCSEAFVTATVGRILRDPDVKLSILLASYRVPEPTVGFVERTLERRVSVSGTPPAHARGGTNVDRPHRPAHRAALWAAAAALILVAGLWFARPTPARPAPAATPMASFAVGLGHHAARQPRADTPPLDGFFGAVSFAENDGVVLLTGARR